MISAVLTAEVTGNKKKGIKGRYIDIESRVNLGDPPQTNSPPFDVEISLPVPAAYVHGNLGSRVAYPLV
jgi:hypothetical protein